MKTLAIVGSHPDTRDNAPWDNPAVDIWVFNEAANQDWVKRWDAVLQLHLPVVYQSESNRTDPKHWEWLQRNHGKPIYMQQKDKQVPDSLEYPLDAICKKFLGKLTRKKDNKLVKLKYFTNSISYAIALALYQGYERIMLYGAEMQSNTEYSYQRDNVAFWAGVAIGRGVAFEVHSAYNLFDQRLYGYEGDLTYTPELFLDKVIDLQAKLPAANEALKEVDTKLTQANALDEKQIQTLMKQAFDAQATIGQLEGAIEQMNNYANKAKLMMAGNGTAMLNRQEFEQNAAYGNQEMTDLKTQISRLDGQLDYLYKVFLSTKDTRAMMDFAKVASEQHKLARLMGKAYGKAYVNTEFMHEADARIRSGAAN